MRDRTSAFASSSSCRQLQAVSADLASQCDTLLTQPAYFGSKVHAMYNPLVYAGKSHAAYLELAGESSKKAIFLGMNPGPWGMAQTGVPFGEIAIVRDWLGIEAPVGKPAIEHPKRPIEGFSCQRSEVSGRRLWGLFRDRFKTPAAFFREHFVANYCPLVFMDETGANITPDKLPKEAAAVLFAICDRALAETIRILKPTWVIGVGGFAKKRIDKLDQIEGASFTSAQILHPSPASPKANAGWDKEVSKTLVELGIWH